MELYEITKYGNRNFFLPFLYVDKAIVDQAYIKTQIIYIGGYADD